MDGTFLNHSEVLEIAGNLFKQKSTMQRILKDGSPVILVDESQDTNHHIVTALFALQAAHKDSFTLGLIGDMMQRIYGDGQPDRRKPPSGMVETNKEA
ncbi:MAG: UvrD-helicase domain-containing protein [Geminicoccaceae bacterium]